MYSTDRKKPLITGEASVKEGDALNLHCSVNSFPPSILKWTKMEFRNETKMYNITEIQQEYKRTRSLSIPNVTAGDAGLYICSAEHLNSTLTEGANVKVICKYCVLGYFSRFVVDGMCRTS